MLVSDTHFYSRTTTIVDVRRVIENNLIAVPDQKIKDYFRYAITNRNDTSKANNSTLKHRCFI